MISKEKQLLRKKIRQQLSSMEKSQGAKESILLQTLLSQHPIWKQAQTIALFYPFIEEPDLLPLLKSKPAIWCFPDWDMKTMIFRQWTPHISSPPTKEPVRPPKEALEILPKNIDLILVPGLAFDALGGRLGRGEGFYDRYLSQPTLGAYKLGIGFSIQKVARVPTDTWDVRLDEVLFGS